MKIDLENFFYAKIHVYSDAQDRGRIFSRSEPSLKIIYDFVLKKQNYVFHNNIYERVTLLCRI